MKPVKIKTAAVYARYSTDLQNDMSVDDQITYCRNLSRRAGFEIDEQFIKFDRAKTAATMFERDGLLSLMKDIRERKFDVIICECLDRLSRDKEDLEHIFKRCEFNGIKIWTNRGETTDVDITIGGLIGSRQLKDNADKVRRHHDARVREGKIPGAVAYGYRCVDGKKSEREVDPDKAKIIVRIFTEYTIGNKSTREIAEGLTRDGIPNPSGGKHWNHQIFTSSRGRGGILGNPIYIGKIMWNMTRGIRNPDTGKKIRQPTKPEEVITVDAPHLRIIEQSLWDRTQQLIARRAEWRFGPGGKRAKRKASTLRASLLSGMVICGQCGGGMILTSSRRRATAGGKLCGPFTACNAAHYHRSCEHRKSYDLAKLERGILKGMKAYLTSPEALIEATKAYHEKWAEKQKEDRGERNKLQSKIAFLDDRISRAVEAITELDTPIPMLVDKLKKMERERSGAVEQLRCIEAEDNVVSLHPAALEKFKSDINTIHAALSNDLEDEVARLAFRNVFDRFVLHPTERGADYEVTPYARLSAIMGMPLFPTIRTVEEMVQEQRVSGSDLAGRPSPISQNWTSDLVCLGRWREAA